jgi:diguanylate cyclase (GGDEF)-like protein
LANRTLLADRLRHALHSAARTREVVAALFMDLDGFKGVNDRMGHAKGDELLRAVADELREMSRASDTVARFGGDEFVVVVEHARHDDEVLLIERLREAVARAARRVGLDGLVSGSVGAAWSDAAGGGSALGSAPSGVPPIAALAGASAGELEAAATALADRMLMAADAAMYEAKRARHRP